MIIEGIILAFLALFAWGFGDFIIQKAVRVIGDFRTLFWIGIAGSIVLFPFIQDELGVTFANPVFLILLSLTSVVIFFAALFDFEALKRGKIAIVEPVLGVELPVVVALSVIFWSERLSLLQALLIATTFFGIVLAVTIHHTHLHYHKRIFERGVILAGAGSIIMGLVNFLIGVSSQKISPLMAIWFTNTFFTILCVIYLIAKGEFRGIITDIKRHPRLVLVVSVLDNAAWLFYAFATSLIPIAIATTISESYIAITVILGIFINREKLKYHQVVGVIIAILSIILLSAVTSNLMK